MLIAFVGSCVLQESPLKTIQLLWVNLIMDSLGALALATRGPSDALLHRPPYGESDGLISNVLFRNIVGHVCYQMVVLLLILFGSKSIFGIDDPDLEDERKHVSTVVFNAFVYMQVFNLINARVAGQDMSVLDGILTNPYFIVIFVAIAGVQAILTELAKAAFITVNMTATEWLICLAFGVGSLVIGFLLRMIQLTDRTTEKLDALRALRVAQIKKFYHGVPGARQWEMSSLDAESKNAAIEKAKP
jgi:Ca2+-transporting ATPase